MGGWQRCRGGGSHGGTGSGGDDAPMIKVSKRRHAKERSTEEKIE